MAKGFKGLKIFNNKRTFTIPESIGLSEEEKNRIITSPKFEDFVINIESLNFIFLRDERDVQLNVYIQTEKEVLYGQTLKFPYPKSTNFYELLDKFSTKKRRALDVEELQEQEEIVDESSIPEVNQETFVHPSVVEKTSETIEEETNEVKEAAVQDTLDHESLEEAFGESEELQEEVIPNTEEEEHPNELKECANCGFNNDLDAKFCSECGFSFIGKKAAETPSTETGNSMSPATKDLVAKVSNTGQETFVVDPQTNYQSSADDMQQLLKVKDGLKNRAQIEKDVALEFESKKAKAIKAADEKVEEEKRKELEALNRTFKEKQELARRDALEVLSVDEKNEVNSRVDAMKNYLKQVYETGLRSIDEGFNMKSANE
ncbi:zinc ribbon domain-containing protein [Lactococcus formosensis]|uniref:zinc ribbon domain-containing protein n=1 Tax=Lactococcus formosensis TaxID=1281486 RepID=UPI002434EA63|nr:zinc ribbon domain-containing protein [Lactococcus formosensis]MDG6116644.1 zinc ribbon domain-containing protein [Lactococcus formosensis]